MTLMSMFWHLRALYNAYIYIARILEIWHGNFLESYKLQIFIDINSKQDVHPPSFIKTSKTAVLIEKLTNLGYSRI